MSEDIIVSREGDIATVTLFNPGKLNAVTAGMWLKLKAAMLGLHEDESLRCVVIRGEGGAFAAGGDIEEFAHVRDTLEQAKQYHGVWVAEALQAIVDCRHPTVALIQGPCIGGGLEIAGQCDLRIAGESARFGAPIMKLGFTMAASELVAFLSLAGQAVALEILLEGRILTAREAYEKGLLTRLTADADVEAEAYATARRIAAGAPLVARWHKQLVRRLLPTVAPLSDAEVRENFAYLQTEDYREGLAAFKAKKKPVFSGR